MTIFFICLVFHLLLKQAELRYKWCSVHCYMYHLEFNAFDRHTQSQTPATIKIRNTFITPKGFLEHIPLNSSLRLQSPGNHGLAFHRYKKFPVLKRHIKAIVWPGLLCVTSFTWYIFNIHQCMRLSVVPFSLYTWHYKYVSF